MEITEKAKTFATKKLGCSVEALQTKQVSGGYSLNRKSLVGFHGVWIFVKEVDASLLSDDGAEELSWLKKEFGLTQCFTANGFTVTPEWSELSDDGTVLLLTAYRPEDGWIWGYPKDDLEQTAYVDAVIHAVKQLEPATFSAEDIKQYTLQPFFRDELAYDDSFELFLQNKAIRTRVINKLSSLTNSSHSESLHTLKQLAENREELQQFARVSRQLANQPNNTFSHCDVRSDNLSFNARTKEVKLIDWNWASFTSKNFGATEFLIDAARHGVDVSPWKEFLNPELLAASVGYWMKRCIKDPLQPSDTLREMQAESAAIAYKLYQSL